MAAGAAAYIAKQCDREEILDVLFDAALGRRRVQVGGGPATRTSAPRLSSRERSALIMLNHGWEPLEIALLAGMTAEIVEAHVAKRAASSAPPRPTTRSPPPRPGACSTRCRS